MIDTPPIKYELAEKQQAIPSGGIGTIMQLIQQLDLRTAINQAISAHAVTPVSDSFDLCRSALRRAQLAIYAIVMRA